MIIAIILKSISENVYKKLRLMPDSPVQTEMAR